jgi:fructose-bisphosphate aldolase class I
VSEQAKVQLLEEEERREVLKARELKNFRLRIKQRNEAKRHGHASGDFKDELMKTCQEICVTGKGILAADESTGTIGQRLAGINVENTHENRKAYRELLFTAPDIEKHISGVIMFDETVKDTNTAGDKKFCDMLRARGIHCGIKVDTGLQVIGGTDGETATQGLDGLG